MAISVRGWHRTLGGAALFVAVWTTCAIAQGQNPAPPSQPTFRSSVNVITVDVRVVDENGRFVRGLTADDFTVFEENDPQEINGFSLVDIPFEPPAPPRLAGKSVAVDVVSNAQEAVGRLYVLFLDDKGSQSFQNTAIKAIAKEFIEHHVAATDRVAIVSSSGRDELTRQFTGERTRLLETVEHFQGEFGADTPGRFFYESISGVANWMGSFTARRKSIIIISPQIDARFVDEDLEARSDVNEAMRYVLNAAARGNVALYLIDPVGNQSQPIVGNIRPAPPSFLVGGGAGADTSDRGRSGGSILPQEWQGSLEINELTEATGGFSFFNSNDFAGALDRIVADNSTYYLLSYTSSHPEQRGKFRRIKVAVNRPGAKVSARNGYVSGETLSEPAPVKSKEPMPRTLLAMLRSAIPVPGLTLDVSAPTFRATKRGAYVDVVVEARGTDLLFTPDGRRFNGALDIVTAVAWSNGQLQGERGHLDMKLSPGTHQDIAQRGVRLLSHLPAPEGTFQLRVGATDAGGGTKFGSVQYDLKVPDYSKGAVSLSSLTIGTPADNTMVTRGKVEPWQQRGTLIPSARRQFDAEDEVMVYAEIYSNKGKPSDRVDARLAVFREGSSEVVFSREMSFPAEKPNKADWATFPISVSLPARNLPPGRYVLGLLATHTDDRKHPAEQLVPFTRR